MTVKVGVFLTLLFALGHLTVRPALSGMRIEDDFVPTTSPESLTAPLAVGGVLTAGSYAGLVRLDVAGSGTNNIEATDGFYSFERPLGFPVPPFPPADGSWIAVGQEAGGPCLGFPNLLAVPASLVTVFVDGLGPVSPGPLSVPPYSVDHGYALVADLGNYTGRIYLGNRDCGFDDNTGALEVTVTGVTARSATTTTTTTVASTLPATTTTSSTLCLAPPDADGDAETDTSDRCPGTAAGDPVDDAGCSISQFCARVDVTTRAGARACRKADWRNDEPTMRGSEADCFVDRVDRANPTDDVCRPVPVEP